ncbi:MAG: phage terminase large subunit family protein, partial [Armatimonadetes bacterium]|nr:phage terminase large subunit family protein [Armatimonadota bacterium]
MVIRKAAQMGASEYAISRALHFADVHGGTVIYYFPSDHDVREFSKDRFAPAIMESDYLRSRIRDTDTAGLKQIGIGSVYLRGALSRPRMKSVPADFLVFDELDEIKPNNYELATKRLGHSEYGYQLLVSTPSYPLFGIDEAFEETDQRHWLLLCEHCRRWWCLEDLFLEHHGAKESVRHEIIFVEGEPGREELICVRCGGRLHPSRGAWVARRPDQTRHGYHLSKFMSVIVSEQEKAAGCLTKPSALLRAW